MNMKKMIVLIALCMVLTAGPAAAKGGFYLGADFAHDNPRSGDVNYLKSAIGLDLRIGYNFGPVSLETNLLGSTHDDRRTDITETKFGGLTLDVKIPFTPADKPNLVYVLVGFGGYSLTYTDPVIGEVKYSGGGMNLGVGTEHFFNPHLAFDLAAIYRSIKYDTQDALGASTELVPKVDGDTLSIEAGLNYHF